MSIRFQKVSDCGEFDLGLLKDGAILEFISCLSQDLSRYIRNLSHMYVLVGLEEKSCMTDEEKELLKREGQLVLAFILMDHTSGPYHTIEYLWTRASMRKQGLARILIKEYEKMSKCRAVPGEIASAFWKQYFANEFKITTVAQVVGFKQFLGLPNLRWDLLIARLRLVDDGFSDDSESELEYKILPLE